MTREEAIRWLEAILEDTLDPNDDSDAGRREAVTLAIQALRGESVSGKSPAPRPARCPKVGEPASHVRIRERIAKRGERALNNTELLATVLGSGSCGTAALKLAEGLLRKYGFEALPGITLSEWSTNDGVGPATACRIRAVFELGRRAFSPRANDDRPIVSSPREAFLLVKDLSRARKEHLVGLYLDAQNRLIARETISVGSLNTTRTQPREILQPAIERGALGFILAHNHPSGSLTPSQDDVDFTRAIRRARRDHGDPAL